MATLASAATSQAATGGHQALPAPPSRRRRFSPTVVLSYLLIAGYSLTLLVPLYWLLISSFKDRLSTVGEPLTPGFTAGFSHYVEVWHQLKLGNAMISSTYITLASMALTVVLAVPASYALARSRGRISTFVERVYSLGFLIPGMAALVPTLLLAIQLHLFNTREFMILYLSASAQPLAVVLLTQFMRAVPRELEESATMDGAGRLRVLLNIYLPLTIPGVATVSILHFISAWNEYLFTLVITGANPSTRTLQVALPLLQGNRGITDYAVLSAGTVISVVPVFLVYAILNRRMEDALVQGAVKG